MKELIEEIKEIYTKEIFYEYIAENGILLTVLYYLILTIGIIVLTIIPIIPLILINEKSKKRFEKYKCPKAYNEKYNICKKCKYKEECKNGF